MSFIVQNYKTLNKIDTCERSAPPNAEHIRNRLIALYLRIATTYPKVVANEFITNYSKLCNLVNDVTVYYLQAERTNL